MDKRIQYNEIDDLIREIRFSGGGFLGGGNIEAKREYVKATLREYTGRYSDGREDLTEHEWSKWEEFLRNNRKDILSDQDIEAIHDIIQRYLR